MKVISRREFGYRDEFEGYVILKDEVPIAQLHLYEDYYTLFWRGRAALETLGQCLGECVDEVRKRVSEPFESLNKGIAQYGLKNEFKSVPFEIARDGKGVPKIRLLIESHQKLTSPGSEPIGFARFDIQSSLNLPIILWADLADADDSEVGFSTTGELPTAILQLLQRTCRVEVSDSELEEIRGHVLEHIMELVPA